MGGKGRRGRRQKRVRKEVVASLPDGTQLTAAQLVRELNKARETIGQADLMAQQTKAYLALLLENLEPLREGLLPDALEELATEYGFEKIESGWIVPTEKFAELAADIVDSLDRVLDPIDVKRVDDEAADEEESCHEG